jgi:acetolactate synthase-1/2/3 large subunit
MAAREVLEEEVPPVATDPAAWQPIAPAGLPPDAVAPLAEALMAARRPLVVTSYLGRVPEAVAELVRLCGRLGVGVLDSVPNAMNFPADDPLYQGNQWNEPRQNEALAEADVVLVIDSDVPWIPVVSRPRADAAIFHIDVDPLKQAMPLWYIGGRQVWRAEAAIALRQLNAHLDGVAIGARAAESRRIHWSARHAARAAHLREREAPHGDVITGEVLSARIRAHLDASAIVLNETISNYTASIDHLRMTRPGSMFGSGAGSLGWHGGAAIGMKLARPEATVIALCGDGSFMFSVPSAVYWIARQCGTPFLTVIYNNRGWKSPKLSALAVHPEGYASRANEIGVSFDPPPDYGGIAAAAGGAFARRVERASELDGAIGDALRAVREERRCAVLDVWLPHL